MTAAADRPWIMRMRWVDLLFAHWPVPAEVLRPLVPSDLEIDTFEGLAYLGIVPFRMEDVAPRGFPALPSIGAFPEVARAVFHLPYFHASMSTERAGDAVTFRSRRRDRRGRPAALEMRYRPTGPVGHAAPGSLEGWLTDRLRLFAVDGRGRLTTTEVRHDPWPLRPAEAEFRIESLAAAQDIRLPDEPPHLRFADRLDVVAWRPRRL
jgi:uncharacterized protein